MQVKIGFKEKKRTKKAPVNVETKMLGRRTHYKDGNLREILEAPVEVEQSRIKSSDFVVDIEDKDEDLQFFARENRVSTCFCEGSRWAAAERRAPRCSCMNELVVYPG